MYISINFFRFFFEKLFIFHNGYDIIELQGSKVLCITRKGFPRSTGSFRGAGAVTHMKITIYGKQMSVRESLKAAVEKKLAKFDKFFGEDTEAFVTCKVRKGVKIIEITVNYGGTTFRCEEENETFITALDRAVEGLERQIRKNKTRLEKMVKRGAFVITEDDDDEYVEEEEFEIRTKTFPFKPMTPEEAILQMNLIGHEFYAFTDSESGDTCVVYKRKAGSYGLIVPEK